MVCLRSLYYISSVVTVSMGILCTDGCNRGYNIKRFPTRFNVSPVPQGRERGFSLGAIICDSKKGGIEEFFGGRRLKIGDGLISFRRTYFIRADLFITTDFLLFRQSIISFATSGARGFRQHSNNNNSNHSQGCTRTQSHGPLMTNCCAYAVLSANQQ